MHREKNPEPVVNLCVNVPDAKTGDMFLYQQTWKVHSNVLKHVRLGCLSNVPGLAFTIRQHLRQERQHSGQSRVPRSLKDFINTCDSSFPGFTPRHAWPRVFWLCSPIVGTLTARSLGRKVWGMV
jgi:hypothetical protein